MHQISVGIVTRNRPTSLGETLQSLRKQASQPYEIIVSDDSSSDSSRDQVRQLCHDYGVRYLQGPQRGLYANRNAVAVAATGTHLRTMDDDHTFPEGHWEACEAAVDEAPRACWIIGEILRGQDPPATGTPVTRPGQLHPQGFSVATPGGTATHAWSDGAAIIPMQVFADGHRYSEHFKFGAAYLEWGSRLASLGYEIRFLDNTYVIHDLVLGDRSFEDADLDAASRYWAGMTHSFRHHPTRDNKLLFVTGVVKGVVREPRRTPRALLAAYRAYRRPLI